MGDAEGEDGKDGEEGMAGEGQEGAGHGRYGEEEGGGAGIAQFLGDAVGEGTAQAEDGDEDIDVSHGGRGKAAFYILELV